MRLRRGWFCAGLGAAVELARSQFGRDGVVQHGMGEMEEKAAKS